MFSVTPLNKSTTLSFTLHPCTYYTNNLQKFYSVTSLPHLMQPLKATSHWKRKDMRVEVKISTYHLPSDVTPGSSMFPVMTTPPLTLPLHAAQVPASHITSLYITDYYSIALKMRTVQQLTFHLLTTPHHHRTSQILHSSHIPSPSIPFVMT